jgi:nitric oxide dioxygenase
MSKPLSEQTIAIVKATVPALEAEGLQIVRTMYGRMFANPAIRAMFNQTHHGSEAAQPKALALAILAYARNIDRLGALGGAVERIAQKHVGLLVLPEHYPHVAEALLAAIRDVLGAAATDAVLAAWAEAYWFLADLLIGRENAIYREAAGAPGGWQGLRRFRIAGRTAEGGDMLSLRLEPEDGLPVLRHRPGQYLSFHLPLGDGPPVRRNYSISSAPADDHYCITVRREPGGLASNWLHDAAVDGAVLETAPPAGDFHLDLNPTRPVVLLSAGSGLTPMLSMLEWLIEARSPAAVQFIHGTHDGATHAAAATVRALVARSGGTVRASIFYSAPRAQDRPGIDFDHSGHIGLQWLLAHTPSDRADYYICGPTAFLHDMVDGLAAAGVPAGRIHYEFFGPAEIALAA